MSEDMVAAAGAQEFEPKALYQVDEVSEEDILQVPLGQPLK
jgi:hypothetical protein